MRAVKTRSLGTNGLVVHQTVLLERDNVRARAKDVQEHPALGDCVGEAYDTVPLEPNGIWWAQHLHDLVFAHAWGQVASACRTRSRDATDS
jgi:hypothetical protein